MPRDTATDPYCYRIAFRDSGELRDAYSQVQADPWVESCSVDVPQLELLVRWAAPLEQLPAARARRFEMLCSALRRRR
jgi:hypothetical protein